jgi:hypothetical protein
MVHRNQHIRVLRSDENSKYSIEDCTRVGSMSCVDSISTIKYRNHKNNGNMAVVGEKLSLDRVHHLLDTIQLDAKIHRDVMLQKSEAS